MYITWFATCIRMYSAIIFQIPIILQWRHNGHNGVSNHQPHDSLLNRLFRHSSKKTSKLRVTDLCEGNSPGTGVFPAQKASNAENVSIWWRHHVTIRRSRRHACIPSNSFAWCIIPISARWPLVLAKSGLKICFWFCSTLFCKIVPVPVNLSWGYGENSPPCLKTR